MKVSMSYGTFKDLCISMAEDVREFNPDVVVAVMRGGMSAAHIIAKHLRLPCECYIPVRNLCTAVGHTQYQRLLFVEDLVAQGRTYKQLQQYMETVNITDWQFAPVLVDDSFVGSFRYYGMRTKHWVVFPYEDNEKMLEGDRGLFRLKTDSYGCTP